MESNDTAKRKVTATRRIVVEGQTDTEILDIEVECDGETICMEAAEIIEEVKEELEVEDSEKKKTIDDIKEDLAKDDKKAKSFLASCKDYLSSKEFDNKCSDLSRLHKVSKTKIAETFCQKVLATIGDTLGIVISVTYNACKFLIKLLAKILSAGCGFICSVAYKISSFFTLGYTLAI